MTIKSSAELYDLTAIHYEIEQDNIKNSSFLGYSPQMFTLATMPHRKPKTDKYVRKNGNFTLTMVTSNEKGLPYGTIPRLILAWVCSELVIKKTRYLTLGDNLSEFLYKLGLKRTGGVRGDITRLKDGLETLFSAVISCHYSTEHEGYNVKGLHNILLADHFQMWEPQNPENAGKLQSQLIISEAFFKACIDNPIPFHWKALQGLKNSPLALDICIWLPYRLYRTNHITNIPWSLLFEQFGTGYAATSVGKRNFKAAFLRELKKVCAIYPNAKIDYNKNCLILMPSEQLIVDRQLTLFYNS